MRFVTMCVSMFLLECAGCGASPRSSSSVRLEASCEGRAGALVSGRTQAVWVMSGCTERVNRYRLLGSHRSTGMVEVMYSGQDSVWYGMAPFSGAIDSTVSMLVIHPSEDAGHVAHVCRDGRVDHVALFGDEGRWLIERCGATVEMPQLWSICDSRQAAVCVESGIGSVSMPYSSSGWLPQLLTVGGPMTGDETGWTQVTVDYLPEEEEF